MTTTRRLAAILAADVAGYSAAMERDEEGTATAVRALRHEVIEPKLSEHQGRLIKTTGDGFLAEFASPIAALKCALAIQQRPVESGELQLRIGLNLGDVIIEEGGDLLGEGVNVAARLEGLAEPGGILISDKILREVEGKVEAAFDDHGDQQVKNIAKPIRAYAVRTGASSSGISASFSNTMPLPLPDKPSIAVLPFQNMSGDPEQEYFADGMVEDIITALSRFKSLFVIARNSSFTFKGKAVDIKQVGRELGVRYVLEGSVRKAGGRVRITGQLIEAATGTHLWADRIDGELKDVFDLQDRVTSSVVASISPKLMQAEIASARRKPTASLTAYDYYLRGLDQFYLETREGFERAFSFFCKAIELDPTYAAAYAFAGRTFSRRAAEYMIDDRDTAIREGERYIRKAIALAQDDDIAFCHAGMFLSLTLRDPEAGRSLLDQAIALNPNVQSGLLARAWIDLSLGEHRDAIRLLEQSLRRNPRDPMMHHVEVALAHAHFFLHEFDKSLYWSEKALARTPEYVAGVRIASLAQALSGNVDKALQMRARLPASARANSISEIKSTLAFRRHEDVELWCEAGRRLGLPE
jgi:adenylate cyclase